MTLVKGKVFVSTARKVVCVATLVGMAATAMASGVISKESAYSTSETIDRVEVAAKMQGMKVLARINHAKAARKAGKQLRDSEVLVVSMPALDAEVMACGQTAGLDMPNKLMAWKDIAGEVWLSYGHPSFVAGRHNLSDCDAAVKKLADALEALAVAAVGQSQ